MMAGIAERRGQTADERLSAPPRSSNAADALESHRLLRVVDQATNELKASILPIARSCICAHTFVPSAVALARTAVVRARCHRFLCVFFRSLSL
uniref:Uncharacterized protein n=1 Tax=Plectus sambesii TaxID=2011161 RepID=A0A914VK04_9BILA